MKKRNRVIASGLALMLMMNMALTATAVRSYASTDVVPYISFGADLKDAEKKTVMKLLEVSSDELADYKVIESTNEEEHKYLDKYIDSSVIGSRALSSVKIEENGDNDGINVTTKNINFCTEAMYVNALSTAGISDAEVTVAGPFPLSGTAALVGAIKAYSEMHDETVDEEKMDAAVDELVTTGDMIDSMGSEKAAQLMAVIKDAVVKGNLETDEDILKAIDDGAKKLDITLTDDERQKILSVMKKIGDLDLDISDLEKSAKKVYDAIASSGIDLEDAKNWFEKIFGGIGDFFGNIFSSIGDFFKNLF